MTSPARQPGRRPSTSRRTIFTAAMTLFDEKGYAMTSVDDIAAEVGISRRTLFRYYPSKAAIAWGEFDVEMDKMRRLFTRIGDDATITEGLEKGLISFNTFPDAETAVHRERMRLLLDTEELQAHSMLMYSDWRLAIAGYVAARRGESPGDLIPSATGHAALGIALSAYRIWVDEEDADQARLHELLREGTAILA